MNNNDQGRDVNKISAVAGLAILVVLVVGLLVAVVVVSLHTDAYLSYEEGRIRDAEIKQNVPNTCSDGIVKKANNAAQLIKTSVEIKDLEINNINDKGECIKLDAEATSKTDCPKTLKNTEILVTLSGIKKNVKLVITNDNDDSTLTIKSNGDKLEVEREGESKDLEYKVTKDSYSFIAKNQHKIVTYTLTAYYSEGDCSDLLSREIKFESPKFNQLSYEPVCVGKENYPNCKPYIYGDNPLSQSEFNLSEIVKEIDKADSRRYGKDSLKNTKTALIVVSIIVIVLLIISIGVAVIGVKKVGKGGALHENEIDHNYDEDTSEAYEEFERTRKDDDEEVDE